jgi:hypothetical protein
MEKPEGKRNSEDLEVDVRIILKWIFENFDWGFGLDRCASE